MVNKRARDGMVSDSWVKTITVFVLLINSCGRIIIGNNDAFFCPGEIFHGQGFAWVSEEGEERRNTDCAELLVCRRKHRKFSTFSNYSRLFRDRKSMDDNEIEQR